MCGSADVPDNLNMTVLREKVEGWMKTAVDKPLYASIQYGKDSSCHLRAQELIPKAWGIRASEFAYADGPEFIQAAADKLARATANLTLLVQYRGDVGIKGPTTTFANHVALIVAAGKTTTNHWYCVVYDPDVDATQQSKDAWAVHSQGLSLTQDLKAKGVLEKMVLGEAGGLGPLFRYYYVPTC
jgi:hypothetical protein